MNFRKQPWLWYLMVLVTSLATAACRPQSESTLQQNTQQQTQVQSAREVLFENLKNLQDAGRIIFGQQSYSLMAKDDEGTKNIIWEDKELLSSASRKIVGDDPGVLGIDVHYFAIVANENAHKQTSKAIKTHIDRGGVVAFDWHMRGCFSDDNSDKGMYTNVDAYGSQGATKLNNKCVCAIANNWQVKDGQKAQDWLFERVDKFADQVKALGSYYSSKPMVFRPFHEHTGNWFWWHEPFWDCTKFAEAEQTKGLVTGVQAYKKVFRSTVNRLRGLSNGLDNFLVAYSPDKLYGQGWDYSSYPPRSWGSQDLSIDQLKAKYHEALPKDVVDIYGFDIYNPMQYHRDAASNSIRTVSELAQADGKVAAITEAGSYEIDSGKKNWYMNDLLAGTIGEQPIAFVMTWENRARSYVPVASELDSQDFINFHNLDATMFLSEISDILDRPLQFTKATDRPALQGQNGEANQRPQGQRPDASRVCIDEDGDGWGWDGQQSCKVGSGVCVDENGDGWGWDGQQSCKVGSGVCVDEDGDGWGWDGQQSCKVGSGVCVDEDGDGWGWDGQQSCQM